MKLHFVDTMDEVLQIALEKPLPAVSKESQAEAATLPPPTEGGDQPATHQ
jgi:ATP-dependent Lon protease